MICQQSRFTPYYHLSLFFPAVFFFRMKLCSITSRSILMFCRFSCYFLLSGNHRPSYFICHLISWKRGLSFRQSHHLRLFFRNAYLRTHIAPNHLLDPHHFLRRPFSLHKFLLGSPRIQSIMWQRHPRFCMTRCV